MTIAVFQSGNQLIANYIGSGEEFAFYLYGDSDEPLEKTHYRSDSVCCFDISTPGFFKVKAFVVGEDGVKNSFWSDEVFLGLAMGQADTSDEPELILQKRRAASVFSNLQQSNPPRPDGWFVINPKNYTAQRIIEKGWALGRFPSLDPVSLSDWEQPGAENRSWGFHLHAWEFMDPVMQEFTESGNLELLDWMVEAALNWSSALDVINAKQAMAWYDMALSLRAPRLARLLIILARAGRKNDFLKLFPYAEMHIEMLLKSEAFNPGNNHGFFAAASSIDFARLMKGMKDAELLESLGNARMRRIVKTQFGADGGHLEHSPDYHRMLLASFESALEDGLIVDDETQERIRLASRVMGWMIQPDGRIVQFGDSPSFDVDTGEISSINESTKYIISNGVEGTPETSELLTLPHSGYAFIRSPQPSKLGGRIDSSYLAFQAGFHSRAHKHADDLTFVWFDQGHELLVDAGRYGYEGLLPPDSPLRRKGYYYGAPERIYVESTRAHNTIELNGENHERKNRKPFGSGLGKCTEVDGRFIIRGSVEHGPFLHERMLRFAPGDSLEIIDIITPASAEEFEVTNWFNFNGDATVTRRSKSLVFEFPQSNLLVEMEIPVDAKLVEPIKGHEDPLIGWRSVEDRVLEPTWNFGLRRKTSKRIRTTTVFRILDSLDVLDN